MDYDKKSIDKRALHKREYENRVNERQMHTIEEKVDTSKALDASLVDTESNGIEFEKQDTSIKSGNDIDADDAYIRPIYDEEPMADVQLTVKIMYLLQDNNILSNLHSIMKERLTRMLNNVMAHVLCLLIAAHYLPKERESAVVKPNHVIASSESRNSSKNMPRFSLNDMVHNHYLEEAKEKTQERGRNSRPSVMPSAKS
nr:hypothetical protein [Tanacetum cinerariifolium]